MASRRNAVWYGITATIAIAILAKGEEGILLSWSLHCPHGENALDCIDQPESKQVIKRNPFTVSEDGTLDDIEPHEGDFPILLDPGWKGCHGR